MNFFLATYTIRIENKRTSKGVGSDLPYLTLSNFDGKNSDLLKIMYEYFEELKTNPIKDENQKIHLGVSELKVYNRLITGTIDSGVYGLAGKLVDTETNAVSYEKKVTDADVFPFFFLLSVPEGKNEALLILGRVGTTGIRKQLGKSFGKHFSAMFSEFTVVLNTLVPDKVVQQILFNGAIKKLRFIKYNIPTDRIDGFDEGHKEIPMSLEIVYSASMMLIQERLKMLFGGSKTVKTLFELRDFDFDYDTIKVDVKFGDQDKTVNLSDWAKVRNYINITKEIRIDVNGYLVFSSIESKAKEIYEELSKLLYKKVDIWLRGYYVFQNQCFEHNRRPFSNT